MSHTFKHIQTLTTPEALKTHIDRFKYWRRGGTSFTSRLYDLMSKADRANLDLLSKGFPVEVELFLAWRSSKTEAEFFEEFGIKFEAAF